MERIIGKYGSPQSDTLIIAIAGMHGNEPAGVKALENVFHRLYDQRPLLNARFIGLRGNIRALQSKERFIHEDFNRIWSKANIQLAREGQLKSTEIKELGEILEVLDALEFKKYSQKVFVDLHTTSGDNGTFVVDIDYPKSRYILDAFKVPVVLGLEEKLESTAMRYFYQHGFVSFAFEGGLHHSPQSVGNIEWALWQTLLRTKAILAPYVPDLKTNQVSLEQKFSHLPALMGLKYLYRVRPSEQFKMRSGFKNFDSVKAGQVIAENNQGLIEAPEDGYLLMPLYQKHGDDGFFIIQEYNLMSEYS